MTSDVKGGSMSAATLTNQSIAAQQMPAPGHDLTKFIKEAYIGQNYCYVKMENTALKWELLILSCLHDELRLKN